MLKAFYFEDASYRVEFRFNDACLVLSVLLIYWSLWVNTLSRAEFCLADIFLQSSSSKRCRFDSKFNFRVSLFRSIICEIPSHRFWLQCNFNEPCSARNEAVSMMQRFASLVEDNKIMEMIFIAHFYWNLFPPETMCEQSLHTNVSTLAAIARFLGS